MKGLKRARGWGSLVLIVMLVLSTAGCRFNFSSGSVGEPIELTDREKDAAFMAEMRVLDDVDVNRFAKVWDDSAPVLKKTMGRGAFIRQGDMIRKLVPPGYQRMVAHGRFHSAARNWPEGRYATFVNQLSCFEATCTEQVVMMQVDGDWRLAGYFVHKRKTFRP